MYTRYAIFEGTVHPGREDEFFRLVEERLLPLWRQMPHARRSGSSAASRPTRARRRWR